MTPRQTYDPETGEELERSGLAPWQKLLAALSLTLGVLGFAFGGTSSAPPEPTPVTTGDPSGLQPEGFISGMPTGEQPPPETVEETPLWAPLMAKGGLSFFLAFCIGYALRAALKVTMLAVGVIALATFGLQYAGVIGEIDWARAQGFWDDLTANLGTQFQSLKDFVAGSLPTAASGAVGLVAGFRRNP